MIYIEKEKIPPAFLTYSRQPGAHFDDMPSDVKQKLRESLCKEQGGLCAYCMQRIHADGSSMKIEHFHARSADNELDYRNLLAVCHGGDQKTDAPITCDSYKGNRELHVSPLSRADMATISYTSNGEIRTSKTGAENELDVILNLNEDHLVANRQTRLMAFKRNLMRRFGQKGLNKQEWNRLYEKYAPKRGELYFPYVGILLWYIQKKRSKANEK